MRTMSAMQGLMGGMCGVSKCVWNYMEKFGAAFPFCCMAPHIPCYLLVVFSSCTSQLSECKLLLLGEIISWGMVYTHRCKAAFRGWRIFVFQDYWMVSQLGTDVFSNKGPISRQRRDSLPGLMFPLFVQKEENWQNNCFEGFRTTSTVLRLLAISFSCKYKPWLEMESL